MTQIQQKKGTSLAADVLDVGGSVATASTSLFAPYEVADLVVDSGWPQESRTACIPGTTAATCRSATDPAKFGTITSLSQLLGSKFKNDVALQQQPDAEANAALNGVMMASLAEGGSAGSITDGVNFFHSLKAAGNFNITQATPATIKAGTTPVVFNWDLPQHRIRRRPAEHSDWKVFIPSMPPWERLLLPGHQQGRAAPGGRSPMGGVPVLPGRSRRAEPVAGGWRQAV